MKEGVLNMKRRIGILTSGGDCPGLNAAIRGVARAAYEMFDAEIIGIRNGYGGLIQNECQEMTKKQFSGILTLGGTILGTTNKGDPFHFPVRNPDGTMGERDRSDELIE